MLSRGTTAAVVAAAVAAARGTVAVAARSVAARGTVAAAYGGKTETGPFQPSFM